MRERELSGGNTEARLLGPTMATVASRHGAHRRIRMGTTISGHHLRFELHWRTSEHD
jgi:hypothetical protein